MDEATATRSHGQESLAVGARALKAAVELVELGVMTSENLGALEQHCIRIERAFAAHDLSLAIGSIKDFVESVSRVILSVASAPFPPDARFAKLLGAAHDVVAPMGQDIDATERRWIDRPRQLLSDLDEVRNQFGTGHGDLQPRIPGTSLALLAVRSGELWAEWSLQRIVEALRDGRVQSLIDDLAAQTFRKGELADRLAQLPLSSIGGVAQHRLGVAVGRRAAGATFVVRFDGVQACTVSPAESEWPLAYRCGLVRGLVASRLGQLQIDEWSVERLSELIDADDSGRLANVFSEVVDEVLTLPDDPALLTEFRRVETLKAVNSILPNVRGVSRVAWERVQNRLAI